MRTIFAFLFSTVLSAACLLDPGLPKIYIVGEIDQSTAILFCAHMDSLEIDRKAKEITVVLSTPGGSVFPAFQIVNKIHASKAKITTYCDSLAMSAGALILSCGHHRVMAPLSFALIHSVGSGCDGRLEEMEARMVFLRQMNAFLLGEIASNCKQTLEFLQTRIKSNGNPDLFLTPAQALELGLIDRIGYA